VGSMVTTTSATSVQTVGDDGLARHEGPPATTTISNPSPTMITSAANARGPYRSQLRTLVT
jgi:hypothetical protein